MEERYELVYIIKCFTYNHDNERWVYVIRMNSKQWKEPLKLKHGYKSLIKAQSILKHSMSFKAADIEWYLYCAMDSFLQYQKHSQLQVMC